LKPAQYKSQDDSNVYFNVFIFKQQAGKQKILKQMAASVL